MNLSAKLEIGETVIDGYATKSEAMEKGMIADKCWWEK